MLEEPPVMAPDATTPRPPRRTSASAWRFASRLARREVRRRPGRTALVAALVAVPVIAMTLASITYRTLDDDWGATFERRYGDADLAAEGAAIDPTTLAAALESLPPGSEHVTGLLAWTGLELADGHSPSDVFVRFTDLPIDHPITRGAVEVRAGRAPAARDEMLLDQRTAGRLGVGVGDTLSLARPSGDWRVVGIGRTADSHSAGLVVVHDFAAERVAADQGYVSVRIRLPEVATEADAFAVQSAWWAEAGMDVQHRWSAPWEAPGGIAPVAWGWVAGVLALVGVGIVIASAFATSARRQLVTVGHLAANGAAPALVRRSLALQGSWTGVVGVVVGVTAAFVMLLPGRGVVETLANRSVGAYRVVPLDLVVIAMTAIVAASIAAAVPARSAAQVPVLSALAGRRPLGVVPRRLVPTGIGLFLGGLALLFLAATGARGAADSSQSVDVFAFAAVLGGVAVVFGMCCATPLVVAWVGRIGGSARSGTWRLAARSLARTRSRSAAVVTAVAAAGALAVAGVTIAAATVDDLAGVSGPPANVAYVEQWTDWWTPVSDDGEVIDPPPLKPFVFEAELRIDLSRIVPAARFVPVRAAGFDPAPFRQDARWGDESIDDGVRIDDPFVAVIADDAVLDLLGVGTAVRERLASVDVVYLHRTGAGVVADGESFAGDTWPVTLAAEGGDVTLTAGSVTLDATDLGLFWALLSEETARDRGLDVVDRGVVLVAPEDLTSAQRRDLEAAVWGTSARTVFVEPGDPPIEPEVAGSGRHVYTTGEPQRLPVALVHAVIIAAAVLFTLLVVAIGLSLSATESRDERNVLVAVGAKPSTMSKLAGAKALTLATAGVLLAVPTGYLPTWVVHRALDARSYATSASVPWVAIGLLVLVVPIVAGLAAWAASSVARGVRPVRITVDPGE